MNNQSDIINAFPPITLQEMKGVKLLNRTDTKYVTTRAKLFEWLELAQSEYSMQDFNGRRLMPYHTIYYDTPSLGMYFAHHNRHLHRQKVRVREYENEHEMFLELKDKNNHGRTKKKRISIPELAITTEEQTEWIDEKLMHDATTLKPVIENRFHRITLVNKAKTERLTIDLDLELHSFVTDKTIRLDDHVIIELKRDGLYPSPAIGLLQKLRIKPCGFSKYAVGMALTDPTLKQNNFKQRIRYLNKLTPITSPNN